MLALSPSKGRIPTFEEQQKIRLTTKDQGHHSFTILEKKIRW